MIVVINDIELYVEYEVSESSYKPYTKYYQPTLVTLINSDIDLSPIIGEGVWIQIEDELRKQDEQ
jgi:hypothetical protein